MKKIWISVISILSIIYILNISDMKMILWSEMTGKIVINNQPAAKAIIKRHYFWHWKDKPGEDMVVANEDGSFYLPTITGIAWLGFLPHEPVIEQTMTVEYDGQIYQVWAYFKRDYVLNDEHGGKPINIICHLDKERAVHDGVSGRCEFQ